MSPPPDGVNAQSRWPCERPPALTVSIGRETVKQFKSFTHVRHDEQRSINQEEKETKEPAERRNLPRWSSEKVTKLTGKMPFTEAEHLPSFEELDVQELNMTAAPLRAGAHHLGKYCDNQSKVNTNGAIIRIITEFWELTSRWVCARKT